MRESTSPPRGFVGRDALVAAAVRRADDGARLLTFTGRHGAGKSRVARAVAEALAGPLVVVELEAATGPGEYLAPMLDALPVEGATRAAVLAHLRTAGGVMVLDACRATDVAAEAVGWLLREVPSLQLVVTAHRALGVPGEVALTVPPLGLPPPDETDPELLAQAPAVALFLATAARAVPQVVVDDVDLPTVAEVCRRLDGLPLAVVTAASRLALLEPAALLGEMSRLGAWRMVGLSVEDEVQRSLDALDPPARQVARALATMSAGAALSAVATVAAMPEADVLPAVIRLVELQLASSDPVHARYALSSSAAECVRRRWTDDDQWRDCLDRHTAFFQEQARAFGRRAPGSPMDRSWLLDHHNRLDALAALRASGQGASALRLAVDCMVGFEHRGEPDVGRRLLAEVLREVPESTSGACISAHLWLGRLEAERADGVRTGSARAHFGTALRLARQRGHLVLHLEALNAVAENQVVLEDGVALAEQAVREGLALTQAPELAFGRAVFLAWQSTILHRDGRVDEALDAVRTALDIAQLYGDRRLLMSFAILYWQLPPEVRAQLDGVPAAPDLLDMADEQGDVRAKGWIWMVVVGNALDDGDDREATTGTLVMLRLARRTWQRPLARQSLVATIRLLGRFPQPSLAALLAGVLSHHDQGVRAHLPPRWIDDLEAALARARLELGDDDFDALHREGSELGLHRALDRAEAWLENVLEQEVPTRGFTGQEATPAPAPAEVPAALSMLTPREVQVLVALAGGSSNKEIAKALGLRTKTVAHHCASIYEKLGARNRTEAATVGLRYGLVPLPRG